MGRLQAAPWTVRILETPDEMKEVEYLQRLIWPGSETEVVPIHVLITFAQNGGLVLGAYEGPPYESSDETRLRPASQNNQMIGFVYGFPGLYYTPDGPRPKHCSHQLGVHPSHRGKGLGFALKRAQWQMARHQGVDLITWTFDPLISRNAHLNITRLGGVSSVYIQNLYGELQDEVNRGLITDRLRVDWWTNSRRVNRRLSRKARRPLDLAHYLSADASILNPTMVGNNGWPSPSSTDFLAKVRSEHGKDAILLVEIPADFLALKTAETELALQWRLHTREIFENLFKRGYLVTDFVYLPGQQPRSFYVLSHGESTL
jgi:predicted GNAT superfamily acetyltransferase